MIRVLIAEDEYIISFYIRNILISLGHKVIGIVDNGMDVINESRKTNPDIIFIDISLKDEVDGNNVCKEIKREMPDIKVVFITAFSKAVLKENLKDVSYDGYLEKPFNTKMIKDCISKLKLE